MTLVPPIATVGATTTAIVDVPPLPAIEPPEKLQVTVPEAFAHDQLVPIAETNVIPAGRRSWTCAVVAAAEPLFVTVSVYVELLPTVRLGVGADLANDRRGTSLVFVKTQVYAEPAVTFAAGMVSTFVESVPMLPVLPVVALLASVQLADVRA